MIKLTKPGQEPAKLDKFDRENTVCTLDASDLLAPGNEILASINKIDGSGLVVNTVKTRKGKYIQLEIPSIDIGTSSFLTHKVYIHFTTNLGNSGTTMLIVKSIKS